MDKKTYLFRKTLERVPIQCPECGKISDSIKEYKLPYSWTFSFIAYSISNAEVCCCSSCMRKHIIRQAFSNLIKANVIWPITILPWSLVLLTRTFVKGHSEEIIDNIHRTTLQQ